MLHNKALFLCFAATAFPADCTWQCCPFFVLDPWQCPLHGTGWKHTSSSPQHRHRPLLTALSSAQSSQIKRHSGSYTLSPRDTSQWERLLMQDGPGGSFRVTKYPSSSTTGINNLSQDWYKCRKVFVDSQTTKKQPVFHFNINPLCCTVPMLRFLLSLSNILHHYLPK